MDLLTGWFPKSLLEQEFKCIQLNPFFGINNFNHIEAMKVIIVRKLSKFYVDFENSKKLREDVHGFEENSVWTCCKSLWQLWQKYMWSAINVPKKCPKISYLTKRHHTELSLVDINQTLGSKFCRADFSSVFDPLTIWFPKGVLKQDFSGIQRTTFFEINNFGRIEPMKVICFPKWSKVYVDFQNTIKLPENIDGFEHNCVWTCCGSFCQLWQ